MIGEINLRPLSLSGGCPGSLITQSRLKRSIRRTVGPVFRFRPPFIAAIVSLVTNELTVLAKSFYLFLMGLTEIES